MLPTTSRFLAPSPSFPLTPRPSTIATWDGTEGADGANGYVVFNVFVLSDLLFYSYHSSSFPIISFSVEYNNRRAGRDRWQRRTGRGSRQARQVRLLLLFLFLLSSFLLLAFVISFVANYSNKWGGAEYDGAGRDGEVATTVRYGTGVRRAQGEGRRPKDASKNLEGRTAG